MDDLTTAQVNLQILIDERDYISELLDSGKIKCADRQMKMSTRMATIKEEINNLVVWD